MVKQVVVGWLSLSRRRIGLWESRRLVNGDRCLTAIGIAALVIATVTACGMALGPSASPPPSASPTATATEIVTREPTASSQPTHSAPTSGTSTPSATPQASFDCSRYQDQTPALHFDPVLEAAFPESVDGHPLARPISFSFLGQLCQTGIADIFVAALPAGIDPATIAVADAFLDLPPAVPQLTAYRVPGHSADELVSAFVAFFAVSSDQDTVAGKEVTVLRRGGQDMYFYPSGDLLFRISQADDAQLKAILQALP
jgi:hypothetical protein